MALFFSLYAVAERVGGQRLAGGPEALHRCLGSWVGRAGEQSLPTYFWAGRRDRQGGKDGGVVPESPFLTGPCHSQGVSAYILARGTRVNGATSLSSVPGGLPFSPTVCVFKDRPSSPGKNQGPSTSSSEGKYGHCQLKRQPGLVRRAGPGSSSTNLLGDLEQVLSSIWASVFPSVTWGDCVR